jgi:hypothetical protein
MCPRTGLDKEKNLGHTGTRTPTSRPSRPKPVAIWSIVPELQHFSLHIFTVMNGRRVRDEEGKIYPPTMKQVNNKIRHIIILGFVL